MCSSGCIKISDFGLTEDIYSQNYFRQAKDGAKLPLKWMALESMKIGLFSIKSDVVRWVKTSLSPNLHIDYQSNANMRTCVQYDTPGQVH
jgi:hypothetical protein